MNEHDDHDGLLREIASALDVEPRAGFEARVLASAETNPTPRPWWLWPSVGVACAAALAAVLLRPGQGRVVAPAAASVSTEAARIDGPGSTAPVVAPESGRLERRAAASQGVRRVVARVRASRRAAPDVVIDPEQARLLEALLMAVAAGRAAVARPDPSLLEPVVIAELPAIPPIEIPLIHIEPLPDRQGA